MLWSEYSVSTVFVFLFVIFLHVPYTKIYNINIYKDKFHLLSLFQNFFSTILSIITNFSLYWTNYWTSHKIGRGNLILCSSSLWKNYKVIGFGFSSLCVVSVLSYVALQQWSQLTCTNSAIKQLLLSLCW